MAATALDGAGGHRQAFRHEAVLYRGGDGFLDELVPFVVEGVEAGEAVLVATDRSKIEQMRSRLDDAADAVRFVDIQRVGRNPARIIPVWRSFVDDAGTGRAIRGIGEPIWAGRTEDELVECHLHESLLNVAFADAPGFWLVCPYDANALTADVIGEVARTHPVVVGGDASPDGDRFGGMNPVWEALRRPLVEPTVPVDVVTFDRGSLSAIRRLVSDRCRRAGMRVDRTDEFVLAVNEVVTNSLRHGGGEGTLRLWDDGSEVACEVQDRGHIDQPMVGREAPGTDEETGRGLWLVNQLCDLVQLRTSPEGTVVRVHMRLG